MCFRPAEFDTAGPVNCPNCGKRVNAVSGVYPKKCPFCKISIEELQATAPPPIAPTAPSAPSAAAPKPPAPPKPPIAQ